MIAVTNHSTLLDAYSMNAACLYGAIRPRGRLNGERRRVIITSPPYGLLVNSEFRPRLEKLVITSGGNLALMIGRHLRAAWLGILASMYLCLNRTNNNRDLAVIVLKNFRNTKLHKLSRDFVGLTIALAEIVGFKHMETLKFRLSNTGLARYHTIKGHSHDPWHKYTLAFRKVI
ncbi:hypothetical protein HRbin02_01626 [Candidatus Calditenuaceae archaeon HR02]|nr:hypothetical protein HRbin02_01626 [Candidatus Calditenuaceae archaeon HR02]